MDSETERSERVRADVALAEKIRRGDAEAWAAFVKEFTGWALYRATRWCEARCPYGASPSVCGLKSASESARTLRPFRHAPECDDGMDIYVWLMEQLQKKVTRYRAKNNSTLSTYVFTILNSKELYVDFLRWKYGRVF